MKPKGLAAKLAGYFPEPGEMCKRFSPVVRRGGLSDRYLCERYLQEAESSMDHMKYLQKQAQKKGADYYLCNREDLFLGDLYSAVNAIVAGDFWRANKALRSASKAHIGYHRCLEDHGIRIPFHPKKPTRRRKK